MTTTKTSQNLTNFVTRPEFESFEKSVDNNFKEIYNNFSIVRDSIKEIGTKIDRISSKGTDYKAIFSGVSVLLAIIIAIATIFAWGFNDKIRTIENNIINSENRVMIHHSEVVNALSTKENTLIDLKIDTEKLKSIAMNHETVTKEMSVSLKEQKIEIERLKTLIELLRNPVKE